MVFKNDHIVCLCHAEILVVTGLWHDNKPSMIVARNYMFNNSSNSSLTAAAAVSGRKAAILCQRSQQLYTCTLPTSSIKYLNISTLRGKCAFKGLLNHFRRAFGEPLLSCSMIYFSAVYLHAQYVPNTSWYCLSWSSEADDLFMKTMRKSHQTGFKPDVKACQRALYSLKDMLQWNIHEIFNI